MEPQTESTKEDQIEDMDSDIIQGTTMNLRKFRKATVKKRQLILQKSQLIDKEICKKKRRMLIGELVNSPQGLHSGRFDEENSNDHSVSAMNTTSLELVEKSELLSETSNTMTLEQFTDIVLASEGMTMNNINNNTECTNSSSTGLGSAHGGATPKTNLTLNGGIEKLVSECISPSKEEMEKKAMVATILQNKDLTVEVKTAKSKPVVLSPRENNHGTHFNHHNSVVVSVKPRLHSQPQHTRSQNLVEEWLQKMPSLPTPVSSSSEGGGATSAPSALNLSLNHSGRPIIQPAQYSRSSPGAFNNSNSNSMTHITTPKSASISGGGGSTPSQMDSLKSRAIRDIQLSHTKDMHGNYPLHMSVLMRKPELVKRYCCTLHILEASLDLINDEKHTPLHLAVRDNSIEIIEILLAFGANPSIRDFRGNTCLHMATAIRSSESLKLLAESVTTKEELNVFNNFGITPLHIAMMNDDKPCVDALLRHGADPKMLSDLIKLSSIPKEVKKEGNLGDTDFPPSSRKNVLIHS